MCIRMSRTLITPIATDLLKSTLFTDTSRDPISSRIDYHLPGMRA